MKSSNVVFDFFNPKFACVGAFHTDCLLHRHIGHWEIIVVDEGTMTNTINDALLDPAHKGEVFVVGPPHTHSFTVTQPHTHWDVYCDDDTMQQICNDIHPDLYRTLCSSVTRFSLSPDILAGIVKHLELIDKRSFFVNSMEEGNYQIIRKSTDNIIAYLLNYHQLVSVESKNDTPKWLNDFVFELKKRENIAKHVQDIVSLSNYSYPQLSRSFKKYFNCSLIEFISKLRLNYAEKLLLNCNESLLEIALEVGYCSHTVLIKNFKKHYGVTPKQYRKQHSGNHNA